MEWVLVNPDKIVMLLALVCVRILLTNAKAVKLCAISESIRSNIIDRASCVFSQHRVPVRTGTGTTYGPLVVSVVRISLKQGIHN